MDNFLIYLDWQLIGTVVLLGLLFVMMLLFKRTPSDSEKVLKVGAGLFVLTFFFSLFELSEISNYLAVLGFVIITFALIRLFWNDSRILE